MNNSSTHRNDNPRKILVIGATGTVGGATVEKLRHLSAANQLAPIAAVRSASQKERFEALGVESRFFDLDKPDSIADALRDIDGLLLLTGYSVDMLKQSKRVIDEAKKQSVRHIVHIGASGNATAEVAHWGWHRMIEAYIEQQGFEYTHLQPEAYMQNLQAFGWLQEDTLTNLIGGATWSWVDGRDVGKLAAAALADPESHAGMTYRLGYEAASLADLSTRLSAHLGRELRLDPQSPDDFFNEAVRHGADPAYMDCIRTQFHLNAAGAIKNADATYDATQFQRITGDRPMSWHGFITEQLAA